MYSDCSSCCEDDYYCLDLDSDGECEEEVKYYDTVYNSNITVSSSVFLAGAHLNGIQRGYGGQERVGDAILMKSVRMHYVVETHSSTNTMSGIVRFIIVYDKQPTAPVAPLITDILASNTFIYPRNLNNRDRFIIICDHLTDSINLNGKETVSRVIKIPLNIPTYFDGVAAPLGDVESGGLWLFAAQSGGLAGGAAINTITAHIRIKYVDK